MDSGRPGADVDHGDDPGDDVRVMVAVIATGLLVLGAPTAVQVGWLLALVLGAWALRLGNRPRPGGHGQDGNGPGGNDGGGGGGQGRVPTGPPPTKPTGAQ